jgi:hypothetical protein
MTALALIKLVNKNMVSISESVPRLCLYENGLDAPLDGYPEWPSLTSRLLASVYKVLGLLNMVYRPRLHCETVD